MNSTIKRSRYTYNVSSFRPYLSILFFYHYIRYYLARPLYLVRQQIPAATATSTAYTKANVPKPTSTILDACQGVSNPSIKSQLTRIRSPGSLSLSLSLSPHPEILLSLAYSFLLNHVVGKSEGEDERIVMYKRNPQSVRLPEKKV